MDYKTQAKEAGKYFSPGYMAAARWSSYAIQIREAMMIKPRRILEIGPGNNIVTNVLREMKLEVETLDLDARLHPNHLGSITDGELASTLQGKFDLVIACQILEHIRYEDFPQAIKNIRSIAPNAIISLPHTLINSLFFPFIVRLPKVNLNLSWKLVYKLINHEFNGEHYWDMGTKGYPVRRIKKDIQKQGWNIKKSFFNPDNPYHYFFILKDESRTK